MSPTQLSNSDWIAISSAVVAICALVTSIWQGYLSRRHNVLSVRPHLEVVVTSSIHGTNHLALKNGGLGPAVLDSVQFVHRKGSINILSGASYMEFLRLLALDLGEVEVRWYVPDQHSIVSQGESIQLLAVSCNENTNALSLKAAFDTAFSETTVAVEYRCMYGKIHRSKLDAFEPIA